MSDELPARYSDDQIDLFDLVESLWAGKLVIFATTVLSLLTGLGILLSSAPTFEVKATYSARVAHLSKDMVASRAVLLSQGEWLSANDGAALALITEAPMSSTAYEYGLEELNQNLRVSMLREAQTEVHIIENEIDSETRQTEVVADALLQAKRIIFSLQGESPPLVFGPVSITELKQNFLLVSAVAAFLGAFAGSVFVLLRKAFQDRRRATAQIKR